MLLDVAKRRIEQSRSPLSFVGGGGDTSPQWDRYLAIDGKKAFHIGNVCETCAFFFERMEGAQQSVDPKDVAGTLEAGVTALDPNFLDLLERIIPSGEYRVLLSRVTPRLVTPGDESDYFTHEQLSLWAADPVGGSPHSPKTEYYRLATKPLSKRRGLFEFLVPTFPRARLDAKRVGEYVAALRLGREPTAVALSVLDVKVPAHWEGEVDVTEHACLAHYLVDGHHKTDAAARSRSPITLVSFLGVEHGIASSQQLDDVLKALKDA